MKCRHCTKELKHTFVDLGFAPPSNAYLKEEDLNKPELYYPLRVLVCDECWLVQTEDYAQADELFSSEYAYFSSTSKSWLSHAEEYCKDITNHCKLDQNSFVIEVASNDGYLLKNFQASKIPCLGIEPTKSTAEASKKIGIPVIMEFFGEELASKLVKENKHADLILGNNVYAHVPDINDFTKGLKTILKDNGTVTLEFPHLLNLVEKIQFDTIYHEHFSYLSLNTVKKIFNSSGLEIYHVEELSTHGGSLRVYGCHSENTERKITNNVTDILKKEEKAGLMDIDTYTNFQSKVEKIRNDLIAYLIMKKNDGKIVAAYGAAAKGNTLLNNAGIKNDLVNEIYDAAEAKQNLYMPGSHIPIYSPDKIKETKPDLVFILPWNISEEICEQLEYIREWNGSFFYAIPRITEIR